MPQRLLALVAAVVFAGGCAFSRGEPESDRFDEADPFHEPMAGVNAVFTETVLVRYPTGAGNVLGLIASMPIWFPALVVEDVARDDDHHPAARAVMAAGAYALGGVLGAPFVALYHGVLKELWEFLAGPSETEESPAGPEEDGPAEHENEEPPP